MQRRFSFFLLAMLLVSSSCFAAAAVSTPGGFSVSGWRMQDVAKVPEGGADVSGIGFKTVGWYPATVPGTALTTLVDNKVYPDPAYGENDRPEVIPESLARTSYWYRAVVDIPQSYAGRHIWLGLDGINFSATVWVDGAQVGTMRGAFRRGKFDISSNVKAGRKAVVAVLVSPEPHPGDPHEHTLHAGMGLNGGITAMDGPTFLCTIGWDWIPAIRDRDAGIWQKVSLAATGPVVIRDPLITTDLPLPKIDSADVAIKATVENVSDDMQVGVLKGNIEDVSFQQTVEVAPHSSQVVSFDPSTTPALRLQRPRLWWPNGYGAPNLYKLHLSFEVKRKTSDSQDVSFGVRKITYEVQGSDNLTISVNGVPVFIRGGDWGLDDELKRIPRARLEAEIRMHQQANLNMIRNWVGQSTSEDFYELCDKYGILIWDEFFQPNPLDGPNPDDIETYVANVRDKILRFRNHPSIALWCARNEGYPPAEIDADMRKLMAELDPTRLYQPSSTEGRGVRSSGPYYWRTPRDFYVVKEAFKTETGSVSIPTIESVRGMMPEKDWETITDDWAEHDLAKGASRGDLYPGVIASRYGAIANLADFVRKGQMANYEAFRAMYEGRNAQLFHPTTGVLAWMSNPAHPSFVWQIYSYDLEPNASFFAVKKAGEPVHIQFNEATGELEVINNLQDSLDGATAHLSLYNLDGSMAYGHDYGVKAAAESEMGLGVVDFSPAVSAVQFLKVELKDAGGKLISSNFYWHGQAEHPDDLTALAKMPPVALQAKVSRRDAGGKSTVSVTLHNPTTSVALMVHLQLRRRSGERVLPVGYSDNYVSLVADETRTIEIEADSKDLKGEGALVVVDGWNASVVAVSARGVTVAPNVGAQVEHWPVTGLPFQTEGLR